MAAQTLLRSRVSPDIARPHSRDDRSRAGTGVGDQLLEVRLADKVIAYQLVGKVGLGVGEHDPARATR